MKYSIGIDWADKSHMVCIREFDTRRIIAEFEIPHNAEGLDRLENTRRALGVKPGDCCVALETNRGMLVNGLLALDYPIHPIPPAAVKDYRGRRRRTGAKSDRDDAQILADILCQDLPLFPPLPNDSPLAKEIQATYRARKQLVGSRTRVLNQFRQHLKAYFPTAIGLFSRLDSQILNAFLRAFPTQRAAQAASDDELWAFLRQQGYTRSDLIPGLIKKLRQKTMPVPDWQAGAGQQISIAFLDQLAVLREHIDRLEKRLGQLLGQHPDAAIFLSLPRVKTVLAAGLLGEIGDCRDKFDDRADLQALAGTAPVTLQSGGSRRILFRFACNKPLRALLQDFARQSARTDASAWARGYLAGQLERGHSNSRAYRALANRWVCIIFSMWKDRTLYDESYHLHNIALRGVKSPLPFAQVA
jgi:transposase